VRRVWGRGGGRGVRPAPCPLRVVRGPRPRAVVVRVVAGVVLLPPIAAIVMSSPLIAVAGVMTRVAATDSMPLSEPQAQAHREGAAAGDSPHHTRALLHLIRRKCLALVLCTR
jgi:hypothetical protein